MRSGSRSERCPSTSAWQSSPLFAGYLVYGSVGAAVTTIFIFLPTLRLVVLPGPLIRRHENDPPLQGFIKAATAVAAGAIAGAAIVIARDILTDATAAVLSLTAPAVLLQSGVKITEPMLVEAAAVVGLLAF